MIKKLALTALVSAAIVTPSAAHASFLPGTEPEDEWSCSASVIRLSAAGVCAAPLDKEAASRIDLIGGAVVTSKGVAVGYSGTADGGVATAAAAEVRVTGAGINVQIHGLHVTQSGHCGTQEYRDVFSGSVHIDRLVVNGKIYTDVNGHREIPLGLGRIVVGGSVTDHYDNSFDTREGQMHAGVTITHGTTRVTVGTAAVTVTGFCHV